MSKRARRRQKSIPVPLIALLGGGVLLVLAALLFAITRNPGSGDLSLVTVKGKPALQLDTDFIDFGDRKFDVPVAFKIKVTNVGDKPLRFTKQPTVTVVEGC